MKLTLFDAAQSVREQVSKIDPDTGELSLDYEKSRELFDKKAGACVAYALEEKSRLKVKRDLLKAMEKQVASEESHLNHFVNVYMLECMKSAGVTQVTADGLARAILYPDRDESVEIEEGAVFPPSLCNDPKPPSPSLTKIKSAILAGEAVAGAKIVRRDRLTIK